MGGHGGRWTAGVITRSTHNISVGVVASAFSFTLMYACCLLAATVLVPLLCTVACIAAASYEL